MNVFSKKYQIHDMLVGIDEVGRGPIAGPLTVCAFGVEKSFYQEVSDRLSGITDSKKLTEKKREYFFQKIRELKREGKVRVHISSLSAEKIDHYGISAALRAALKQVSKSITRDNENSYFFLDGSLFLPEKFAQETIVRGDAQNWLIGAASVVAKVTRDRFMVDASEKYPQYGFERHKGYGTTMHYANIEKYGLCELHRRTWIKGR